MIVPRCLQRPGRLVIIAVRRRSGPRLIDVLWLLVLVLVLSVIRFLKPSVQLVTVVMSGMLGSNTKEVVETLWFKVTRIIETVARRRMLVVL